MFILITSDVSTVASAGKARLRKVAKECENCGHRVQNSVSECQASAAEWRKMKDKLLKIVNLKEDSIRFYYLGDKYENKIEHYGLNASVFFDKDDFIL